MEKIKEMSIDLETYSDVDIKKSGVYKYAESENFEILLFAVSINGDDVIVYDLACGDVLPDEILDAIVSDDVIKWAFNASFERICLSYWMKRNYPDRFCSYSIPEDTVGNYLNPASWRCTMIWSAYMGLPLSLEGVGTVLGLKDQKMKEGKDLIRYFCVPCKPTKSNGGRTRNLPMHAPEKWTVFKSYNKRDVEVEMGIKDKLHKFPVPDFVWEEYHLDQEINDRGILVDLQMVENAITFDERSKATIADEMRGLTDIDNPNSVSQMKSWLSDQGIEVESLGKKAIEKHGINGHLRQKGKIADLALGYGGSVGALKAMGALEMGLTEDELQPLVDAWRQSNPNIVALWWDFDTAIKNAIKMHCSTASHGIKFTWRSGMLFITLPSGRKLTYVKPRIGENKFGGESVTYEGIGATKKWERLESYGPKFVENVVQAISRDLLMNAMKTLSHCFICGHVHDKLIIECSEKVSLKVLCQQMARTPDWMPDILLRADGYVTEFYKKD